MRWLVLCCLLLSACIPNTTAPNPVATVDSRNPAPLPRPTWVEPSGRISLDNITQIAYIGRLDVPGTPNTIFSYAFSPDATRLAGIDDAQIVAWDLLTGEVVFNTSRLGTNRVFYSSDKTELYAAHPNGEVTVYDTERGARQTSFQGHTAYNDTAAFYGDEGWLALGGLNGEVKVWDTFERQSLASLGAHELKVSALAFSPDGTLLATGGDDGVVHLWNWRDREQLATVEVSSPPVTLAFSPDGAQFAIGTAQNIRLVSLEDPTLVRTIDSGTNGAETLLYSPDGRYVVSGGSGMEMVIWDAATGLLVAQLPGTNGVRSSAAFSPDGNVLVTSVLGGAVNLWDLTQITGETVNRAELAVGTDQIINVAWTSDSRALVLFDATGPVYIWGIGA